MQEKFNDYYRIESSRNQNWDYRWDAYYFVTICTQGRLPYFGNIKDAKVQLSHLGVIANVFWYEIGVRNKKVILDEFIIMPNHIHAILKLENGFYPPPFYSVFRGEKCDQGFNNRAKASFDSVIESKEFEIKVVKGSGRLQNQGKNSLSSIIGSYKSAVSKHANRLDLPNGWQSRFYDRIIRDRDEFNSIKYYIRNNPKNWKEDNFYVI